MTTATSVVTMSPSTISILLGGGLEPDENNKRGSVHKDQSSIPQQKCWQIPSATCLG